MVDTKSKHARTSARVIDITAQLAERRNERVLRTREPVRLFAPPPPQAQQSTAGNGAVGMKADGTIDLATWRAKWRKIFGAEFTMCGASEGSLHFFHDSRSNSLEFHAMDDKGRGTRHVLEPTDAMRLLVALNAAYGFEPRGPLEPSGDDGPSVA